MDIVNFRVAPSSKELEVWVEVPDGKNYEDIEIDEIAITDYTGYVAHHTWPTTTQILSFKSGVPSSDIFHGFEKDEEGKFKKFITRIPIHQLNKILDISRSGMYFLYIQTKGYPKHETPCCCFNDLTIACAINHFPIYNLMLKILNAFGDRCMQGEDILLDLYLKKHLITDAVELSDYQTAIDLYKEVYEREIIRGECLDGCGTGMRSKSLEVRHRSRGCKNC